MSSIPTRVPSGRTFRRAAALAGAAAAIAGGVLGALPAAAVSAAGTNCSSVDVSFARGTFESPGLGIVGTPFARSVTSDLGGTSVNVYAVNYAADATQASAGPGSTDLVKHVEAVAAACPRTVFVLGGYSQGATVVDKALGLSTYTGGQGTSLPAGLASRVKAVVVFGNPLGLQRQTIETASRPYGAKAKSFCNTGDPVCGNGSNFAAHLQYSTNGTTTTGAQFAAAGVRH